MRIIKMLTTVILAFLLLAGCGSMPNAFDAEITPSDQPLQNVTIVNVQLWKYFSGAIDLANHTESLPVVDSEIQNGVLCFEGSEYVVWEQFENKLDLSTSSGWHIDLDRFSPKAKTPSNQLVLTPNDSDNTVICVYDTATCQTICLLKCGSSETNKIVFHLEDFLIFYDGKQIVDEEYIEYLWAIHTGSKESNIAYPVLDGDWTYYSLTLVSKECDALEYELRFGICGDTLYMELFNSEQMVKVPVEKIA